MDISFKRINIKQILNLRVLYTFLYIGLICIIILLGLNSKHKLDNALKEIHRETLNFQQLELELNAFLLELPSDQNFVLTGENETTQRILEVQTQLKDTIEHFSNELKLSKKSIYRETKDTTFAFLDLYLQSFQELKFASQQRGNIKAGLLSEIQRHISDLLLFSNSDAETMSSIAQAANIFNTYLSDPENEYLVRIISDLDDTQYMLNYAMDTTIDNSMTIDRLNTLQSKLEQLLIIDERIGLYDENTGSLGLCRDYYKSATTTYMHLLEIADRLIIQKTAIINIISLFFILTFSIIYLLTIRKVLLNVLTGIGHIKESLFQLSKGNLQYKTKLENFQYELREIGESIENITNGLLDRRSFVDSLLKQRHDLDIQLLGKKDVFGKTLIALKENMRKTREEQLQHNEENKIRRYTNEGLAKFADILRANNDNLEVLSDNFIKEFVKYLNALQGSLFLIDESDDNKLYLASAFAYDRKKYLQKTVPLGEGLIGTCGLEKKTIYLTEIPSDYISITSGLGDTPPNHILLIPVVQDNELAGVIEIASLKSFEDHEINLAESIAGSLAATLITVKSNAKTAKLLSKSQQQAIEMAEQEEEMRQNMEELKATQEDMKRKQEALEEALQRSEQSTIELEEREAEMLQQRKTLQEILDNIPFAIYLKNRDLNYMVSNKLFAQQAQMTTEQIVGKNDKNMPWSESSEEIQIEDNKIFETGEPNLNNIQEKQNIDGSINWIELSRIPLKDESGEIIAVLGISEDITNRKAQEDELKQSMEEFKTTQEDMIGKQKELEKTLRLSERNTQELHKREKELNENKNTLQKVIDNINKALYIKDINSKYIQCNQAFADLTGYNIDDIAGKDDFDMPWKETADANRQDDMNIIASGKSKLNVIESQINKDGSENWIERSKIPLRDEEGKVIALLGMFENITEKLEKEGEYKGISTLINNSLYLIEYDSKATITKVNHRLATYLGLTEEDMVGKKHWEVFSSNTKLDRSFFENFKSEKTYDITEQLEINYKKLVLSHHITSYAVQSKEKIKIVNLINFNS